MASEVSNEERQVSKGSSPSSTSCTLSSNKDITYNMLKLNLNLLETEET